MSSLAAPIFNNFYYITKYQGGRVIKRKTIMKFTVLLLLTKLRNENYINSPPQPTHCVIGKKFGWESRNFINNYNVNVVCCKLCLHFSLSSDSLGKFETHFDTILEISFFMNNWEWETWQHIVNLCTSASNDNQDELFVLLKISLLVAVIWYFIYQLLRGGGSVFDLLWD